MKVNFTPISKLIMSLVLLLTTGCSLIQAPLMEPRVLETPERSAVLEYGQPASENILEGLAARDYAQFSRDFSAEMKTGMDEAAFNELLTMLDNKLGTFQSSDLVTVLQDDSFSTVVYRLTFERDNEVSMRVVFDLEEPHLISGLWFDSPELRGP